LPSELRAGGTDDPLGASLILAGSLGVFDPLVVPRSARSIRHLRMSFDALVLADGCVAVTEGGPICWGTPGSGVGL